MYCKNCGQQVADGDKFCVNCGKNTGENQAASQKQEYTAPKPFQPYSSIDPNQGMVNETVFRGKQKSFGTSGKIEFGKRNNNGKKKGGCLKFILIAFVILVVLAVLIAVLGGSGDNMTMGEKTELLSADIPSAGGSIIIDNDSSPVNGMTISIPEGAFDNNTNFKIAATVITGHKFGDNFNPVTPLITIEYGHGFAGKAMRVTIPIKIKDDEFALGFYYDRESGKLEAIPFDSINSSQITLLTAHFSDIIISKISREKLAAASDAIDTGFVPGKDDWQFVNYGSALAPGGHCAGQSLTMAWYYYMQHMQNKQPNLYGRFDNNGKSSTEAFWQDDAHGYRFASVIQESINWNSPEFQEYIHLSNQSQLDTFYAFAYAILMTGEPQFMGIYSHDENGNRTGGHAILAYKIEDNKIFVADPNYPAQKDRFAAISNQRFLPYSSGSNAADISANGAITYDEIIFVAKSALIDFDTIADNYKKLLDGSIGNDLFPTLSLAYLSEYSQDHSQSVWTGIKGDIENYSDTSMPEDLREKIVLAARTEYQDLVYTLFKGTTAVEGPLSPQDDGTVYFTVQVVNGNNDFGILAETLEGNSAYYADFRRVMVRYEKEEATPTASLETEGSTEAKIQTIADLNGEYAYENSDKELPYIVTYHIITINSDGTFLEKHSWASRTQSQSVTSENKGTWAVKDKKLILTNTSGYAQTYEVDGKRIKWKNQDGITVTFKKP